MRVYRKPAGIVGDNGTEFTGRAILTRANANDAEWHYINLGEPQQNSFSESFKFSLRTPRQIALQSLPDNGRAAEQKCFNSLDDSRQKMALWRYDDNQVRPHSSLDNSTPTQARRTPAQTDYQGYEAQTRKLSL